MQVSTRSPSPASPANRVALRPEGHCQPRNLRKSTRDQCRQRVVPKPKAFDHARCDRDDVLQSAADFDADHI